VFAVLRPDAFDIMWTDLDLLSLRIEIETLVRLKTKTTKAS
jgi:hypothetical protein